MDIISKIEIKHFRSFDGGKDQPKVRIEELKDNLAGGLSVKNMEDYKHQTGQIKALMEVLAMFSEVETKIDKG